MAQNLLLRPSGFYFRYIIPTGYRHLFTIRELRYTLLTSSRRVAKKRARSVAGRVDSLLESLARSQTVLADQQIRATIRRYIQEESERHGDWHLFNPPQNDDEREAHVGILLDELPALQASLVGSQFTDATVAKVCKLFGWNPQDIDRGDLQFLKACREWTHATVELYENHLRRLEGEPTAGQQSYLGPESSGVSQGQPEATQPAAGPLVSEVVEPFIADRQKRRNIADGTADNYRKFVSLFVDLMGDMPAGTVTPTVAEQWRDKLLEYLMWMFGHSMDKEIGAGLHYNKGASPKRLFEEISKVRYECTALDNLGQDWRQLKLFR